MIPFIIYTFLAVASYLFFYFRTKDILNPFGIVLFSLLGIFAIGRLQLNVWQGSLSPITYAIFTLVAFEIFVIGLAFVKPRAFEVQGRVKMPYSKRFFLVYRSLLFLCIVCIILEFAQSGFHVSALSTVDAFDKKNILDEGVGNGGITSYVILLLPYLALFACYELLFKEKKNIRCIVLNVLVIIFAIWYVWFIQLSRGTLLIILLGAVYLIHQKRRLRLWQGVLVFILFLAVLSAILTMRLNMQSAVYLGSTANAAFNSSYNYLALGFDNLDSLMTSGDELTWLNSVWGPILKLFGVYDPSIVNNYELHFFNSKTMLYYYFHDLGIIGVVVYPGIIFYVLARLYNSFKLNKPYYALLLAAMQKAIFMTFFGDYFIGSFGAIFPYLVVGFTLWFSFGSRSRRDEILLAS